MHTYIHTELLFHVVCKSKEYDCNAFVSILLMSFGFGWKPTVKFQSVQPSHPVGGCGVEFVYATAVVRMSWSPVLVSVLLLVLGSPVFSWAIEMGFFTSCWIVKANKTVFHLLLWTMVVVWSKYWKQIFSSSWTMPGLFLVWHMGYT